MSNIKVLMNVLYLGKDVKEAVDARRNLFLTFLLKLSKFRKIFTSYILNTSIRILIFHSNSRKNVRHKNPLYLKSFQPHSYWTNHAPY